MHTIIYLTILSSNSYYQELNNYYTKNNIKNTCEFNTIRFKKEDTNCLDLGQHVSYCNNNNLANEFVVTKELGVGNKPVYTIKPTAMWEEVNNERYKMANFYYSFYCDERDNEPQLELNILPTPGYDISYKTQLFGIILLIVFVCLLLFIIATMFPCLLDNNDSFGDGLLLGILSSNLNRGNNRRTYCD